MRSVSGFTLIELMVAVIIIGILSAIAIPSYQQYAVNARQNEAQQAMMDLASRLEQYRLDARQYPDDIGAGANEVDFDWPDAVTDNFQMTYTENNADTPPTYTIEASPRAGVIVEGTPDLELDSAGNKTPADEW